MLPGICISSPGLEAGGALNSSSAMVEQGVGGMELAVYQHWPFGYFTMVAYFCHHLSDNYVDLSALYVDLSVIYVDLSDHYVDLSEKYHHN